MLCSFSQALLTSTKSKKKKKRSSNERQNESESKEIQESAVLEVANLTTESSKKRKDKKKKRTREQDAVQLASTTASKIPSCSSSSDKEDDMEVEFSGVRAKTNRELVGSKSGSVSSVNVGKKRSSTATVAKPSRDPDVNDNVPVPKKRKLMKTAEDKVKTKDRMGSKSGLPSEKQDKEDTMPKSAGKTLRDATSKSAIASKVCATRKAAVSSKVSTADSSSDTESSDSDNSLKSKRTKTSLSSSENASKTPLVTETRVSAVTKPPPKVCDAEETSDESSSDSDGNPYKGREKLKEWSVLYVCVHPENKCI